MNIVDLLPDAETLLALSVEELAGFLLEHLTSNRIADLNRFRTCRSIARAYTNERCKWALLEAWAYLESEGLVVPGITDNEDRWNGDFITRSGKQYKTHTEFANFRKAALFPKDFISPDLSQEVYHLFLSGDYETAIFKAFKTIEVRVREAAVRKDPAFDQALLGTQLMYKAFDPDDGPLTDLSEPPAERQALQGLFANAISRFKNPASHRPVSISDPVEAVEIIQFASHLLRVVAERTRP